LPTEKSPTVTKNLKKGMRRVKQLLQSYKT
jgi:hypothetical protein